MIDRNVDARSKPENNQDRVDTQLKVDDESNERLEKHQGMEMAHHLAETILGPVGGVVVATSLHTADIIAELSPDKKQGQTNPSNIALNRPHLTLDGRPTSKPVLMLDANDNLRKPGTKLPKKPSEKIVAEAEKRFHERAFSQAVDLTPSISSPFDPPKPMGMKSTTLKKKKRITPI